MSSFDFNQLIVLHLYNYRKPKGEKDPLSEIAKLCQVVKLSTCMRTVFVLNTNALNSDAQKRAYESLLSFLAKKNVYSAGVLFERFEGEAAYQFLLHWMIGGINAKRPFNDTRILGDVRAIWSKMLVSTSVKVKEVVKIYTPLFNNLFADTVQLNKLIPLYAPFEPERLAKKLKTACINCAWSRVRGLLSSLTGFNYFHFAEEMHVTALEASLQTVQQRILKTMATASANGKTAFFKQGFTDNNIQGIAKQLAQVTQSLEFLAALKPINQTAEIVHDESDLEIVNTVDVSSKPKIVTSLCEPTISSGNKPFPRTYMAIWKQPENRSEITRIKAILRDYTKESSFMGSYLGRLFSGHWNRHHVEKVSQIIKEKYESADDLLFDLKQLNPRAGGSLDRRIHFIDNQIEARLSAFNI